MTDKDKTCFCVSTRVPVPKQLCNKRWSSDEDDRQRYTTLGMSINPSRQGHRDLTVTEQENSPAHPSPESIFKKKRIVPASVQMEAVGVSIP